MVLFSCNLDMMLETVIMSLGLMSTLIRLVSPGAHGAHKIPICPPEASITDSSFILSMSILLDQGNTGRVQIKRKREQRGSGFWGCRLMRD